MQGKRNLNADLRSKIAEYFCLTDTESDYFETLVNFCQAKSDSEKNRLLSRLVAKRKSLNITTLLDSQIDYLRSWYNPVIRELVTLKEWDGDFALLGRMVRPAITARQAKKSVSLLCDLGLITQCHETYKQSSPLVSAFPKTISPVITDFHRQMTQRALEALDSTDTENRNMTGCTLHISRETFDKITEELTLCRKRILKLARADLMPRSTVFYNSTPQAFFFRTYFKNRNAAQPDTATDTISLALSFSEDTICILSRQPDHNIILRKFLDGKEVGTTEDIAIAVDNDITPQLKSTPEGDFYISANMTLHRLSHDGLVLLSKKRIAEPFAASSNGIYVIPTYAPYEIIQMNNLFEQTNSITYVQDTSFIASDASVTICAFTANNNGYCCSLIDKAFVSSTSIPPTSPDST